MRAFYQKPKVITQLYGKTYTCDHPKYNKCTLYLSEEKGLAVIQQRYNIETKHTWWSEIDPWLANDIYLAPRFRETFDKLAKSPNDEGIYPTIEVRKLMYQVGLYSMHKEPWES